MQTLNSIYTKYKIPLPFIVCFIIVAFFSLYRLSESPTIWMDEGIITQVARNMAEHGHHELQIAPDAFISAGFVTTSYTVTFPISLSLRFFGSGLLQARTVMVLFILALFTAVYFFTRRIHGNNITMVLTLFLVATFPPLYGDGKNVLGEIPGLLYLITGLIFIDRIDKGETNIKNFILSGIFISLAITTKPIFLMFAPALLFILIILRKKFHKKEWFSFSISFILPLFLWLFVQFHNDSLSNILAIYANPHSTNFLVSIKENSARFIKESQPFYCALLIIVWFLSIVVRWIKKNSIATAEIAAAIFSVFILLAYLRTVGYYRYFLEAQFFALIFFAPSLFSLTYNKIVRKILLLIIVVLIAFQLDQTLFNSWVATYYNSHRTEVFVRALKNIPAEAHVYVYRVPEAILFLKNDNFSQYMEVTQTIILGSETLNELSLGKADFVIAPEEVLGELDKNSLWKNYALKEKADRYIILQKRSKK